MKKIFLTLTIILRACQPSVAQLISSIGATYTETVGWNEYVIDYDTLIRAKAYNSYYSYSKLCPVIVTYTLYQGGGECSRNGDRFINDIKWMPSAKPSDYALNGYDEGHLANAQDFAYDCKLQESTFRWYNCCPQTKELNRGIWKHYETELRKLSQTDSLLIICYNHFGKKKLNNRVSIPDTCYKIAYSLTSHKVVLSISLSNTSKPVLSDVDRDLIVKIKTTIK